MIHLMGLPSKGIQHQSLVEMESAHSAPICALLDNLWCHADVAPFSSEFAPRSLYFSDRHKTARYRGLCDMVVSQQRLSHHLAAVDLFLFPFAQFQISTFVSLPCRPLRTHQLIFFIAANKYQILF